MEKRTSFLPVPPYLLIKLRLICYNGKKVSGASVAAAVPSAAEEGVMGKG